MRGWKMLMVSKVQDEFHHFFVLTSIVYVEYSVYIVFVCNINRKYKMYRILNFLCFHLALSKSIILPDYLTSDLSFQKRLINVWPTFGQRLLTMFL